MLKYFGGPLISHIEAVSVYIDNQPNGWQTDSYFVNDINSFLADIVDSTYMDALAEYSVLGPPEYTIGRGTWEGEYFLLVKPDNVLDEPSIQQVLRDAIQSNHVPLPNANRCYFVFLPTSIKDPNQGGYHGNFQMKEANGLDTSVYYAVILYPDFEVNNPMPGKNDPVTAVNDFFKAVSHELAEIVTDPTIIKTGDPSLVDDGWHTDDSQHGYGQNQEIADLCNPRSFWFHGYQVASFWSLQQKQCINCLTSISLKKGQQICGTKDNIVAGNTVQFFANVSCVSRQEAATLKYEWAVLSGGASIVGSSGQESVSVTMPNEPGYVTIQVIVEVNGQTTPTVATYATISAQEATMREIACKLKDLERRLPPLFLHRLGPDPGPVDILGKIREIHQQAELFAHFTGELLKPYENISEREDGSR